MRAHARGWPAWWCVAWLVCALSSTTVAAAPPPAKPTPKQAAAQKKLDHVRAEIKALAAQQLTTGNQRNTLQSKLAKHSDTLAGAGKAVAAARVAVDEKRAALKDLQTRRSGMQATLDHQRDALAELLRATYALGHGNDLRMLLGQWSQCNAAQPATAGSTGADTCTSGAQALARIDRALAYSRYFQHDRVQRIHALLDDLARLHQVEASIAMQQKALQTTLDERNARVDELQKQRHAQAALLAAAETQLKQQGQRLQALKRDEKSLQTLIARLRDVFADLPRDLPGEAPFASLRGHLGWPLRGALSTHNQGVLLSARPGTPVHAVAHGRVVYAAWLRGYGMLLIVDQGDGWMTLYGGNETLLQDVGDWVDAGTEIATSGQGEAGKAGLYFGLRHHGKAVNPRPWLARKR